MMIMKMVTRGIVLVGGLWATQATLDRLEKSWNKRDERIKKNSEKKVEVIERHVKVDNEHTTGEGVYYEYKEVE